MKPDTDVLKEQTTKHTPQTVAVLIPFYHAERLDWLAQSIISITEQETRHTVRLYLGVDGPMRPELESFLNKHQAHIHTVVHNPVNQGLAVMLTRMIAALQDETFILRLDADDIALPHRIETQINWMIDHPEIDVSGGYMIETDFQNYEQRIEYPLTHDGIVRIFHKRCPLSHPTACFRKNVFSDGNRYPTEATYNEDLGLWLKLLLDGYTFGNVDEALIKFRVQPSFYKKRGYIKAVIEFRLFWESLDALGKSKISGIFPLMRFVFRVTPGWVKKLGYRSGIRKLL
ncbi:MAG: glycosyltransferase [Balneolales bacterium]|nr:glycosyltransferase [Balneolales bacterium]